MKRTRTEDEEETANDLVKVNAGGKLYYTTHRTLTSTFPDSLIARLFARKKNMPLDENGNFFIDADPQLFGAILNVLRRPNLIEVVPLGIKDEIWWYELDYWGLRVYVREEEEEEEDMIPETTKENVALFREKAKKMNREVRNRLLMVMNEILLWCDFRVSIDKSNEALHAFCHIPFNRMLILGSEVRWNEELQFTDAKEGDSVDVASYIIKYAEVVGTLLTEVTGVQSVHIGKTYIQENFPFNGRQFSWGQEVVRVVLGHNFVHK